jgi:MFS family permease
LNTPETTKSKTNRALRISIFEGAFAQVHINLTMGMFLTSLALYVGLNNIGIGLLSAIPAFFTGFGFFSVYLVQRFRSRKALCVLFSGIGRGVFAILGILLLLNIRPTALLVFTIVIVHNILLNFAGNAWLAWMHELVPKAQRGRYFGLRNTILNIVGMAANMIGGKILDIHKIAANFAQGLGLLYTSAAVSSMIGTGILTQQYEPKSATQPPRLRDIFLTPFKDENFLSLIRFVSVWYLLGGIAAPFFLVHMLSNLHMSYSTVALYSIIAGISGLLFQIIWGHAIDRIRSKPVLTINYFCSVILPWFWLFARSDFLLPIWIDAFLTGIFWTGINLSLFNIVFSLTEGKKQKESYFAVFTTLSGIIAFISALGGGFVAQALVKVKLHILGLTIINYHIMFAWVACVRLACMVLLVKVKEKEALPTIKALQLMGDYTLRRLVLYKGLILNTFRQSR